MEKYINSLIRGFKKIFNKKYFAIVSVFIGIVTVLGVSYGYLSSESGWQLAAQLRISKLYYSIAVDGVSTNEIVVPANSGTTYYNVEITSLNDINTRYALTYKVTGTATVKVSSASTNAGSGVIGLYSTGTNAEKKKTIKLAITNTSSSTATVTLSVAGGYTWNPEGQVSLATGYTLVSGIHSESRIGLGLTFAEEIDTILNCTPTASVPCYYTNNSNNYVEYAGHTWRIIGTFLVDSKPVVKLILDEPLTSKVTYANVSSTLTTFYNGLSNTSLIQGSATSLTKAEYDAIGGVNSYLYTKPDKDYWTGTQYYVGTSRGAVNKNSSYTAYVRPVIQLKPEVVNSSSSVSTTSVSTLVTNGSFANYIISSSNLSWNSSLNPNPPYIASSWSNGYNGGVSSPTTGYHAHFNEADFGYLTAKFPDLNTQYGYAHRWLGIAQSLATGAIVAGHKYYLAMDVYSDTVGTRNYSILDYSGTTVASFASYISTSNTINKWSKYSDIKEASSSTSTSNPYALYLYGYNGSSEGTTHIRDVLLVDLTNTFGANNEPSKAWCDANIPFFEGTTTVTSRGDILGTVTTPYQLALGVKLNFVNMENGGTNLKAGYYVGGRTYTLNTPINRQSDTSFLSWSTSGTGASVSGTTLTMGSTETTLTASWITLQTVTFNVNGGNAWTSSTCTSPSTFYSGNSSCTKNVLYGSTYGALPTPTRVGYNFSGWFTDPSGGTQKQENSSVEITSPQTLYAHWTIKTYTVTYNCNGGSGTAPSSVIVNHGSNANISNKPCGTKITIGTGSSTTAAAGVYYQDGWSTSSSGTATSPITITDVTTLYATWSKSWTYNASYEVIKDSSTNWRVKLKAGGSFVARQALTVDIFAVGGGGSGSSGYVYKGGGGGAGGRTYTIKSQPLSSGSTYAVTIGTGGPAKSTYNAAGATGGTTSFGSLISAAGGGGGSTSGSWGGAGGSGGSGGGGGRKGSSDQSNNEISAGDGGSNGGAGGRSTTEGNNNAAGGTGCSSNGLCKTKTYGGSESNCTNTREFCESSGTVYAGGGGGGAAFLQCGYGWDCSTFTFKGGNGGSGGGGAGKTITVSGYPSSGGDETTATSGTANTGGGGGGAAATSSSSSTSTSGAGGTGIVVVRNHR